MHQVQLHAVSRIWSKPARNDVISSGAKAHSVKSSSLEDEKKERKVSELRGV
jgi:hypothetical protein